MKGGLRRRPAFQQIESLSFAGSRRHSSPDHDVLTAIHGEVLSLDRVMNLAYLRLAGVDSYLLQDRHQRLPERIEVLLRVPNLQHFQDALASVAYVINPTLGGPSPHLFETLDNLVMLCLSHWLWCGVYNNGHKRVPFSFV